MLRIRRDKGGRTHYAAAVTPRGTVERWAAGAHEACPVTEDVARKVIGLAAGRPHAGDLSAERHDGTPADLARASVGETVSGSAFAELQAECLRLAAERNDALHAAGLAREAASRLEAREAEHAAFVAELEERLSAKDDRIAALAARVAELEAQAAPAEPQAGQSPQANGHKPGKGKHK